MVKNTWSCDMNAMSIYPDIKPLDRGTTIKFEDVDPMKLYEELRQEEDERLKALYKAVFIPDERFYYLCTPYSKYPMGKYEAYEAAAEMLAFLQTQGLFVYCPIVHSHTPSRYVGTELKNSYDFWLTIDFKFVSLSKGLIICKMVGWEESHGIQEEIKFAKKLGIPIYYTNFLEVPKELKKEINKK